MKRKEVLKKAAPWLLLLLVFFLAYKFIAWNYWQVDRAVKVAKGFMAAPPAVNLSLALEGKILFRQGFPHNSTGNYYIVNRFDITPYTGGDSQLDFYINKKKTVPLSIHRFKTYTLVTCKEGFFAFTTPACTIEEFVELRKTLPDVIKTLSEQPGA